MSRPAAAPCPPSRIGRDTLHLFTLASFSVAQPVFDRLADHVVYLLDQSVTRATLLWLTAIVLLAAPVALSLFELLARGFGPRWQQRAHAVCVFVLLLPLSLLMARHVAEIQAFDQSGLVPYLVLFLGLVLVVLLTRQYLRKEWIRRLVTWAWPAIVLFPAAFLFQGPARVILFPPSPPPPQPTAGNPIPLVLIVFDEFSGMSLLNEDHEIDPIRYPNFARLAGSATWYRNASTVNPRTHAAVPAILTGRIPVNMGAAPIEAHYPHNLFRFIEGSKQFDMVIFEPRTRVASLDLEKRPVQHSRSPLAHAVQLTPTIALVYLHTCLPRYMPIQIPHLPRAWHGLPDRIDDTAERTSGLIRYAWDTERDVQVDHFLRCVRDTGRPDFFFFHIGLPHYPWTLLPSGHTYSPYETAAMEPIGGYGPNSELWTDDNEVVRHWWQRYLIQVQYADRFIGRLQDRLVETGLFDRCLLVVTADHGVSFMPGHSRRFPDGANLADILSVPMFIKLPGQHAGEISDRNIETIDILPTIADVLDYELPEPVDGASILDQTVPPRPRKTHLRADGEFLVVDAAFPEKYNALDRMLAAFGSGTRDDRLWSGTVHQELIGRDVAEFEVRDGPALTVALRIGDAAATIPNPNLVPCCYEGRVVDWGGQPRPAEIAVAVNGKIVCVTRTSTDSPIEKRWFGIAPESAYRPGRNDVRFYSLAPGNNAPALVPCRTADWDSIWDELRN